MLNVILFAVTIIFAVYSTIVFLSLRNTFKEDITLDNRPVTINGKNSNGYNNYIFTVEQVDKNKDGPPSTILIEKVHGSNQSANNRIANTANKVSTKIRKRKIGF